MSSPSHLPRFFLRPKTSASKANGATNEADGSQGTYGLV
jgi:hypothetical protein